MKNQFIKVSKLNPRSFGWDWREDQRILLVGLWFVAVGFDLGLKNSGWYKHFMKKCEYCEKALRVNNREQIVMWHKDCRTPGRALKFKREKFLASIKQATAPLLPWYKRIFA